MGLGTPGRALPSTGQCGFYRGCQQPAREKPGKPRVGPACARRLVVFLLYDIGRRLSSRKYELLAATGAILIPVPGVVGESRFRVPVQPILDLTAGVALVPTESRQ